MRTTYTGKIRAQIVVEMLQERKTISQISSEYGVHPTQLHRWKATAMEKLAELLEDNRHKEHSLAKQLQQTEELYAQIGRLSAQLEWLKKKSGIKLD